MIRNEFIYSPSILSILISSHTFPSFSSRSVVERRGGGEEPGSKGIQNFSKFSLLLYTEKIIVQNNYYVFLPHANSVPSLAKVENKTKSNLD